MAYLHSVSNDRINATLKRVKDKIYEQSKMLKVTAYWSKEPVVYNERTSGKKLSLNIGDKWGEVFDCAWFHFEGKMPTELNGKKVVLLIDVNGEACIFNENGVPTQGLTTCASDFDARLGKPDKREVVITNCADGSEIVDIWADAGCNDLFGNLCGDGKLAQAHFAVCNDEIKGLYYDMQVLHSLMNALNDGLARKSTIMYTLYEACKVLKNYTIDEVTTAREILSKELNKKGGDSCLRFSAVGHAHMDLAWLWPIRETIRKGARTFSTAIMNCNRYPDYVFGASQPQYFDWIKQYYPELYAKVKEYVALGKIEPQGAMWVEADTNISGSEALVRQVLYGKRFFKQEFDKDINLLWLPDVFGYNGALPQILKKSGVKYFCTIKLSWNKFNQHPYHSFIWKGIDGSEVLAHMPPENSYNGAATPELILQAEHNYRDKGYSEEALMAYGIGDGGGGPGEEHLELLKREKNLLGLPPVTQRSATDFFQLMENDRDRLHSFSGELYLEVHNGTYTTQARNKWYNRKMEYSLRDAELSSVLSMLFSGTEYPQEDLEKIWKEVLLYQFHDILPGSSIKRVYDESLESYGNLLKQTKEIINTNLSNGNLAVLNSLSWDRNEWVKFNDVWYNAVAKPLSVSKLEGKWDGNINIKDNILENDFVKLVFNKNGLITSIYYKKLGREVLEKPSNQLMVYQDYGDAWDFDIDYAEVASDIFTLIESETYVDGPKQIMKQKYEYNNSVLTQEIILTENSPRVDFETEVQWRETSKMLRSSFAVNVFASEATCDIQFGNVKRPTHRNTSIDAARFEVPAHKYIDISQGDFGVSLMSDSKYGYKALNNVLDIDLLRSSNSPGKDADIGTHKFTYALFAHKQGLEETVKESYKLNIPLTVVHSSEKSLADISGKVIVESVKKAEDNNDVIIRLYEGLGCSECAYIKLNSLFTCAWETDMMENIINEIVVENNSISLDFTPFEIKTIRLKSQNI